MAPTAPDAVHNHAAQTDCSDPGPWAGLLDSVEPGIEAVSQMARNLIAHYRGQAEHLPAGTVGDIDLRWAEAILATDQARHPQPLGTERPVADRVQGCCRDHTLLAVAALRHHGVPARSRVGFAGYLSPDDWHHDHVIGEAWLGGRWRRFDPEFAGASAADLGAHLHGLDDPGDMALGSSTPFLTGAQVWLGHRAGTRDVSRFGVAEGLGIGGDWFVHGYVIGEVAHRFGDELLLWDQWGAMTGDVATAPAASLELVDEVAALLVRADEGDVGAERELAERYRADDRLHPGPVIRSYSPTGAAREVDLGTRSVTTVS